MYRLARSSTRCLLATVAGLAIALGSHAHAQPPAPPTTAAAPVHAAERGEAVEAWRHVVRFDLNFPGGTVNEYIEAIRAVPGVAANISLSPQADGVPMPPIRLSQVTVAVAVRAVETITDATGGPLFSTRAIEDHASSTLYVITARPAQTAKPEAESLHSFRVASLLDPAQGGTMSADTLLGAIESLLSFETAGDPPRLLLHKETSILMMQARTSVLAAVENLLDGLERDAQQRRELTKPNQALIADLKAEQQAIREKREILLERVNLSEKQYVEAERLIQQGLAPQSERESARERMRALEEQRIELDLRESHIFNRLNEALAASGVQQSETFRVPKDRADATLDAAVAIAESMTPPVSVERGDEADLITFRASANQLDSIRKWLRAQSLLVD